jgi:DNA-binding Lrp family transcriptional regulator
MTKLKDIDFKILFGLMKNSKTSDRQLAKKIGVSQPTVTRRRARLEKELINGYTAVPKWEKLDMRYLPSHLSKLWEFSLQKNMQISVTRDWNGYTNNPTSLWVEPVKGWELTPSSFRFTRAIQTIASSCLNSDLKWGTSLTIFKPFLLTLEEQDA